MRMRLRESREKNPGMKKIVIFLRTDINLSYLQHLFKYHCVFFLCTEVPDVCEEVIGEHSIESVEQSIHSYL